MMADRDEKEKTLIRERELLRQRITELEHCEEERKRTEDIFLDLFNATEEAVFLMDREGIILVANKNVARLYGVPMERLPGTSIYDLIPSDRVKSSKGKVTTVLETQRPVRFEGRLGEKIFENWLYPVLYDGLEVQRIAIYVRDITERKMVEEAFAESEERYRTVIEHSNDAVAIIQGDKIQYVNRRFVEIFGYDKPEDMIGKPVSLVVHPEDREKVITINQWRQKGEPVPSRYEFKGMTKDGGVIYIEVSATSIVYRGTPVYLIYLRDMTERKAAEEVLRNERNKFRILSESAPFGIIMIDKEGIFEYINPQI